MGHNESNFKGKTLKKNEQRTREIASLGGKTSAYKRKLIHIELQDYLYSGELDKIIKKAIDMAKGGNIRAMEWLFDRAFGKAKINIDVVNTEKIVTQPEILKNLSDDKLNQIESWLNEAKLKSIAIDAEVLDD